MGTVTIVHADEDEVGHIEMKTKDGENVTLTVDDQTRYLERKAPASLKDCQVGSRIVATVTMEEKITKASEILLGEGGKSARFGPGMTRHQH